MRIAIGGLSHETNTFNTIPTRMEDFEAARGRDILNSEAARLLLSMGVEVIPTVYFRAIPSGLVEKGAYLGLKEEIIRLIGEAGRVDGVYLKLHGAMEVEGLGSGELDLVEDVRRLVGDDVLISLSLDLHGNVSPRLCEEADIVTAYRTAPHTDVAETEMRAASLLADCILRGLKPASTIVKPPLLLPGEMFITDIEPASSLVKKLKIIDGKQGVLNSSLLVGCAWTDTFYAGASVIVVSKGDRRPTYTEACKLAQEYWDLRGKFRFEVRSGSMDEVIEAALKSRRKPVFISDSGDNVTAGAAGDVPIFIEKLLSKGVKDAVVAGIVDLEAMEACRKAGVGGQLALELGGKLDKVNGYPIKVKGRVLSLSKELVVFRANGVDVIITARRRPFASLKVFEEAGIDPSKRSIVVVKLGYLTPPLRRVAALSLMALSPGFTNLLISQLPYRKIRRPIFPLDRDLQWRAG